MYRNEGNYTYVGSFDEREMRIESRLVTATVCVVRVGKKSLALIEGRALFVPRAARVAAVSEEAALHVKDKRANDERQE